MLYGSRTRTGIRGFGSKITFRIRPPFLRIKISIYIYIYLYTVSFLSFLPVPPIPHSLPFWFCLTILDFREIEHKTFGRIYIYYDVRRIYVHMQYQELITHTGAERSAFLYIDFVYARGFTGPVALAHEWHVFPTKKLIDHKNYHNVLSETIHYKVIARVESHAVRV
jgi:hypothetical protein